MGWICNSSLRFIKGKEGDKVKIFMIHVIMIEEIIKIGTDHIAETREFNLVHNVEIEQGMNRIIGMIIGEEILEVMWECAKILKDRIVGGNIEVIIGMKIIAEKR